MPRSSTTWLAAGAVVLGVISVQPLQVEGQLAFPPGVSIEVPLAPSPLPAMDHTYLVYELHLRNFGPFELEVRRVDVFADERERAVASYAGSDLTASLLNPRGPEGTPGLLTAGGFEVVYVWVELGPGERPRTLRHEVTLAAGDQTATVESVLDVLPAEAVREVGPPLRGGPWVMGHGPVNTSGHRRSLVPLEGRPVVPQRYAIDYFKLDREANIYSGDERNRENHYAYGEDVLAVADGVVASAHDGIPDNTGPASAFVRLYEFAPLSINSRAVPITLETVAGNYVVLDLGDGVFAFYAHFKPGSLRVQPGDRVRKGDVLGQLGLSGNTPTPHLHFGLVDANATLANEGLPYVFDAFEWQGTCRAGPEFWSWYRSCFFAQSERREGEIPLAWHIISFPEGG